MDTPRSPTIAVIGGLDPSGGAGISADCQVVMDLGYHAAPIATAITAQNTTSGIQVFSIAAEQVTAQLEAVFADLDVRAIKIGMLPNAECIDAVEAFLHQCLDLPVVLDPVLSSSTGLTLNDCATQLQALYPHTTLVTPNRAELQALTGAAEVAQGIATLLQQRATTILVKGADQAAQDGSSTIINTLANAELSHDFVSMRLPGTYRGTGCRLATAIAAQLCQQASSVGMESGDMDLGEMDLGEAVMQAEEYMQQSLQRAKTVGRGAQVPG